MPTKHLPSSERTQILNFIKTIGLDGCEAILSNIQWDSTIDRLVWGANNVPFHLSIDLFDSPTTNIGRLKVVFK